MRGLSDEELYEMGVTPEDFWLPLEAVPTEEVDYLALPYEWSLTADKIIESVIMMRRTLRFISPEKVKPFINGMLGAKQVNQGIGRLTNAAHNWPPIRSRLNQGIAKLTKVGKTVEGKEGEPPRKVTWKKMGAVDEIYKDWRDNIMEPIMATEGRPTPDFMAALMVEMRAWMRQKYGVSEQQAEQLLDICMRRHLKEMGTRKTPWHDLLARRIIGRPTPSKEEKEREKEMRRRRPSE